MGKERAALVGGASGAADDGEETALGFLLRENDVLLALLEDVAAIGVVAAGEDVNFRRVGAGEFFVDMEMIADDGSDSLRSRSGIRVCGICSGGFRFGGGSDGCDAGDVGDGADENDVIGLQAGTLSGRLLGTCASLKAGREEKEQE